jgi:glycosyltransferase involved in cell wall biosynthesis
MIEGVACGTPVVSFDVCSAREILEEALDELPADAFANVDHYLFGAPPK